MIEVQKTKVEVIVPVKLASMIDAAAARELTSRAAWVRLAIMERAVREGLIQLTRDDGVSAYVAEMNRIFG